MDESILNSIKAMMGGNLSGEDTAFDPEIIPLINLALATLVQIGAGPSDGFYITGADNKWSDFTQDKEVMVLAREYCFLKVKILWDNTSMSGAVTQIFQDQIAELESRISYWVDPGKGFK